MKELKGACIIGQSGGPTSVINASAYGVIDTALKSPCITQVLGAEHGIKGVLNDRLFDMGLEDRMNTPVGLLSGGQRQALTLLMATMVTPELLLLDEHTAALDPVTADKVLALTRSVVSERSISCLMITHNMHQALELGTRTLMMDAGRIVLDVSGPERADMTVQGLLDAFAAKAGEVFDNDRVLLSTAEDREN